MFEHVEPLSSEKHRSLRYAPQAGFDFARGLTSVPLVFAEFEEAAKHYPIVFPAGAGEALPVALLGLDGHNNFVDSEGRWTATYIPAHVRRYPFILGRWGAGEGSFAVMVDREAPHFAAPEGEPLFNDADQPSPQLQQVMSFLREFKTLSDRTERLVSALDEAGVLVHQQVTRRSGGDATAILRGFRGVDREALDGLPDERFLEWRRQGILPLVYAHLVSLGNLKQMNVETQG